MSASTAASVFDSTSDSTSVSTARQTECVRVLLVEDDSLQAEILVAALVGAGFEADTVGEGMGAVW